MKVHTLTIKKIIFTVLLIRFTKKRIPIPVTKNCDIGNTSKNKNTNPKIKPGASLLA